MTKKLILFISLLIICTYSFSQSDSLESPEVETGLVSLDGKKGVTLRSKAGEFLFKPYVMVQARLIYNFYDDEGLSLAEQDNVLNSGFAIPYALIGFAGKAFNRVTFNLAINPAVSGGALLNQAWFDVRIIDGMNFRVGKFKTPFAQAFLVRLGQTLFPIAPASLVTRVNLPYSINSVNPMLLTGFDLGMELYGKFGKSFGYQLGIFNGTGTGKNNATNSLSDDYGIPSLLYAARFSYTPLGGMPLDQGMSDQLDRKHLLIAASASYNVEANQESSNDLRLGIEMAYIYRRWYMNAEAYMMQMDFVERQQVSPNYLFWGAYAQTGYFITKSLQPMIRLDLFDRNSISEEGLLLMPALGLNYYILSHNLKIQAFYQYLVKVGHENDFEADDDDNGMSEHMAIVQFQFAF